MGVKDKARPMLKKMVIIIIIISAIVSMEYCSYHNYY